MHHFAIKRASYLTTYCLSSLLSFKYLTQEPKMKDFKGNTIEIGDNVIFTDSFNRLLEGRIIGFSGKLIIVTPLANMSGTTKSVRPWAVMKL